MRVPVAFVHRFAKFSAVGLIGIGVQLVILFALTRVGMNYLLATAVAVEGAVLHNFVWHERFTWANRAISGVRQLLRRWLCFNLTTGLVSIAGNLLFMRLLVGAAHCNVIVANLITIAICAGLNYAASDRVVFVEAGPSEVAEKLCSSCRAGLQAGVKRLKTDQAFRPWGT